MKKSNKRRVVFSIKLPKAMRMKGQGFPVAAAMVVQAAAKFERWLTSMLPHLGEGRVSIRFEALKLPPGRPNCASLRRRLKALK